MLDEVISGSPISHVNFLGGYFVLVLPILVAMAFATGPGVRACLIGGGVIVSLMLLYARSMGASIGLLVPGLVAVGLAASGVLPPAVRRVAI